MCLDGQNATNANLGGNILSTDVDLTSPNQYQYIQITMPSVTCASCIVCATHVDNALSTGTVYYTCADVMVVRRSVAYAIQMTARAPSFDYEPMLAESVLRAVLTSISLTEPQGVHIVRWPVPTDDVLSTSRSFLWEIQFNEVPGSQPTGNATLNQFIASQSFIDNVMGQNGFSNVVFSGPRLPSTTPDAPPEQLATQAQQQGPVLSPTTRNTIAASVMVSITVVLAGVAIWFTRDRMHKAFTSASKGFTFTQLAGGTTFVNLVAAVLVVVALTSNYWSQSEDDHMGLFQKCTVGNGNNGFCTSALDDTTSLFNSNGRGQGVNQAGSIKGCKAFMIMAAVPLATMFFWAMSSLFTRAFLKQGLIIAYGGLVASLCSFVAVCLWAAYYNDVFVPFERFANNTPKLGVGFILAIIMIFVSILAFGASLALAAKEGEGTTKAAVTRNWSDAPFSGAGGMAGGAAVTTTSSSGGGGGGYGGGGGANNFSVPINKSRAPSVPERPKPTNHVRANSKGPRPMLPPGWKEVRSKEGDTYYFNEGTGESQWETPSAPVTAPPIHARAPSGRALGGGPPSRGGGGGGGGAMEI